MNFNVSVTHRKIVVPVAWEWFEDGRGSLGVFLGVETTDGDWTTGLQSGECGAHELGHGVIRNSRHKDVLFLVVRFAIDLEVLWRIDHGAILI